ncbi:MAG: twin-arginine translocation signal domain-containing protein [Verrucomicrobia bacterium]|nr:twin-arginine translocation signal domain-containing protein [Verrucomicrobiota bacterium]
MKPHRTATTRRDFLRVSATAAAGAALTRLDVSRTAHAAGSEVIRLGMIGWVGRVSDENQAGRVRRLDPALGLLRSRCRP